MWPIKGHGHVYASGTAVIGQGLHGGEAVRRVYSHVSDMYVSKCGRFDAALELLEQRAVSNSMLEMNAERELEQARWPAVAVDMRVHSGCRRRTRSISWLCCSISRDGSSNRCPLYTQPLPWILVSCRRGSFAATTTRCTDDGSMLWWTFNRLALRDTTFWRLK